MNFARLSKSDFKTAFDCETTLPYLKARIPTNLDENEYIALLSEGGFMVEVLAKAKYPDGTDLVTERCQARVFQFTGAPLKTKQRAVIYEAATLHAQYLARTKILRREGNTLNLINVKSSSVRAKDHRVDGADPEEVRGGDPVFGTGGGHAHDILRAKVGADKGPRADSRPKRAARLEEICGRLPVLLQHPADAQHEREVDDEDPVIDRCELENHATGTVGRRAASAGGG